MTKKYLIKATRNCESDATDCIVAKLEWAYVVKLAHNMRPPKSLCKSE